LPQGVSTATVDRPERGVFDFCYSGGEIRPEQLGETSLITDRRYEEAAREPIVT
jgi:hypothetical protein